MKKVNFFTVLFIFIFFGALGAGVQQRQGSTFPITQKSINNSAYNAVTARSTDVPSTQNTNSARATISDRTKVSNSSTNIISDDKHSVVARVASMQKVVGNGTKVATATNFFKISDNCRQKYMGCMDSFCMLDNASGGRCICSDKNVEFNEILAEIEKQDQQSYMLVTQGVELIENNSDLESVIKTTEEKKSLDLSLWDTSYLYEEDIFDTDSINSPIEGKEGDSLYKAARNICVAQIPECSNELSMLELMYSQQIKSDCTAYENTLKQQKIASAQKLAAAEQALREAALEQYRSANKYDLGQCTTEFKSCMITTGGCGEDFSKCASIVAVDNTNVNKRKNANQVYAIKGEVTTIEISASTYDTLAGKKPLCESVTKSCVAVADQVWDTFLREVAPQLKSAELIAEDNVRQNCIGSISECFQKACKDNMDPNDPDGSYDMCLTRPESMLNLCKVPLNACGIDTSSASTAQESQIWEYVVARLASMRVNSCTTQVKECLQSEDRCGSDYTQCIGLDTDSIIRMCPYDTLVGCQMVYGEENIKGDAVYDELANMVQGIMLNIDNNMLTECQNKANEAMLKVCGDTESCDYLTVDENIGSRSLEYKICEYAGEENTMNINYSNCRSDISLIMDSELGRVEGSTTGMLGNVTPFAGVLDGLIYWDSVNFDNDGKLITLDEYMNNISDKNLTEQQKQKISSELSVLQTNINSAIEAIESDPYVQFCMNGRVVQGMRTSSSDVRQDIGRTGESEARFPELTKQMRLIIANSALKKAKDNYYKKYDALSEQMLKDYATIGERMAEIKGENAKDVRREAARIACISLADIASLPKSPDPPKGLLSKMIVGVIIAASAVVVTVFTAGAGSIATAAGVAAFKATAGAAISAAASAAGTAGGLAGAAAAGAAAATAMGTATSVAATAVSASLATSATIATTVGAIGAATAVGGTIGQIATKNNASNSENKVYNTLSAEHEIEQFNYKETIITTFEWDELICHKCVRKQQCSKTKNSLFGGKSCKKWADPVETCTDIQF